MTDQINPLGGIAPSSFLRDYWQKKPLLIRQAVPLTGSMAQLTQFLSPKQLITLACDDNAQARLITQRRGKWQLDHGPFETKQFNGLGKNNWTVLVQGVNHILPQAAQLLTQFSFIPHARLDDLMVSYAPKGGGVGPHFDSYDVFLLQGKGHRRWQISAQTDRTLIKGAPLRVLKDFKMEQEWVLAPGDMLYLPPQYAHNGIAEDDCMTYSIGFRAPSHQELAEQFLVYLQDRISLNGMYSDPQLKLQAHPGEISADMLRQVKRVIAQIKWSTSDIAAFLGSYLSEPKPHIYFSAPPKPLGKARFETEIQSRGVTLALATQLMCYQNTIFINGTAHTVNQDAYLRLRSLADTRQLPPCSLPTDVLELLYQFYLDGYIILSD